MSSIRRSIRTPRRPAPRSSGSTPATSKTSAPAPRPDPPACGIRPNLGPHGWCSKATPKVVLPAEVTGIRHCLVSDLTDQGAQAEGLTTATELREALKGHYPDLAATDEVDVITFQINDTTGAVTQ
ncbi:ASCH domain-containing protein [Streptomyces bauhiniae]|uniref:ASCH domain-containing protein n=1 Tax=Streptomyces bauhiniae TaxID=2340725 RepID=UPI0036272F5A